MKTSIRKEGTPVWKLLRNESGQDVIEWGLLAAFVSVVTIASITVLFPTIQGWYTAVETAVSGAPPAP